MNAITAVETQSTALALPREELVHTLQNSVYPGAKKDCIALVLSYCAAQRLDPLQKPVHIVPMWDRGLGAMRDVIMPGVGLYRTQAARSGQHAGTSEPEFGPMIDGVIDGQKITYPEWCKVTVRRIVNNIVCEFTATEYWLENYATRGKVDGKKSDAPNAMWTKRPRGQLAKCAEAQALRKGFPELGAAPTAEEMEGKVIEVDAEEQPRPNTATQTARDVYNAMSDEEKDFIRTIADEIKGLFPLGDMLGHLEKANLDSESKLALWSQLPSDVRSALKAAQKATQEAAKAQ